jgi:hypothetical protein
MPRRVVPEGEGKRIPILARVTKQTRTSLEKAASDSGRSLGQEIEFRLNRDLAWEEAKGDIERMKAEAAAMRDAARIQAIREAGLQIVREAGGGVTVSIDLLLAEADGILKSGFIEPPAEPRVVSAVGAAAGSATVEGEGRWRGTPQEVKELVEIVVERVLDRRQAGKAV